MWSDRASVEQSRSLVAQLREIEPSGPIEGVAWLANGPDGETFFSPSVSITYSQGSALVRTASRSIAVQDRAFDLLEAMLEAWQGCGDYLVGQLSYDLAAELEELGDAPPPDFPSMFFFRGSPVSAATPKNEGFRADVMAPKPDDFQHSVRRIVDAIHRGDIFQTNLCRTMEASVDSQSAWSAFQRMREVNPATHAAFLQLDEQRAILSMSPESYLMVRDGVVESRPIKGTRPRGADAEELLKSEKDLAELAMIVDVEIGRAHV